MMETPQRTARVLMVGLVAAGSVMAAIGAASADQQVASVLPPVGAALVAAGVIILLQAESLSRHQAIATGAALVAAGVVAAIVGAGAVTIAPTGSVVSIGAALVAAGTFLLATRGAKTRGRSSATR